MSHLMGVDFYLEKLESVIDLEHVERANDLQGRAFKFKTVDHIPTAINYPISVEEWPDYGFLEIFEDPEKMLLQELKSVYAGAKIQDDRLYGIRANYGTGIIASMFGCEIRSFDHALPIALNVDRARIDRILDNGIPEIRSGIMGRALETIAYFREKLSPYPKLSQAVGSWLLDIQGPFDNASIIWGSEIFIALYDEPEVVSRLLELIRDTIAIVVREHRRVDGCTLTEQGGMWNHLGGVCIRNDSAINLSREQFLTFSKPYDFELLREFAGWIHFCGDAKQWWECLLDIPNLNGINPFQGEFYDVIDMYSRCEAAGIPIVQWMQPLDAPARERIRTGISRILTVSSLDEALRARDRLYSTGHADF
ncbi:MAG: hypothetical protein ACYC64_02020 [Armatimonadota bacterium]